MEVIHVVLKGTSLMKKLVPSILSTQKTTSHQSRDGKIGEISLSAIKNGDKRFCLAVAIRQKWALSEN